MTGYPRWVSSLVYVDGADWVGCVPPGEDDSVADAGNNARQLSEVTWDAYVEELEGRGRLTGCTVEMRLTLLVQRDVEDPEGILWAAEVFLEDRFNGTPGGHSTGRKGGVRTSQKRILSPPKNHPGYPIELGTRLKSPSEEQKPAGCRFHTRTSISFRISGGTRVSLDPSATIIDDGQQAQQAATCSQASSLTGQTLALQFSSIPRSHRTSRSKSRIF
ncbi:hypothetical protein NL676_019040 [Syzygium grande]|nr:hypothetical protein NL676_019040 [Syzygium grande]